MRRRIYFSAEIEDFAERAIIKKLLDDSDFKDLSFSHEKPVEIRTTHTSSTHNTPCTKKHLPDGISWKG